MREEKTLIIIMVNHIGLILDCYCSISKVIIGMEARGLSLIAVIDDAHNVLLGPSLCVHSLQLHSYARLVL